MRACMYTLVCACVGACMHVTNQWMEFLQILAVGVVKDKDKLNRF